MVALAYHIDNEAKELVDCRNKAALLVGNAYLRDQHEVVKGRMEQADRIFTQHRLWDDFTVRLPLNADMLLQCQDRMCILFSEISDSAVLLSH